MRRWPAGRRGPPEVSPAGTSVSGRLPETCPDRSAARPARPGAQNRHLLSDGLSGLAALALLAGALLAAAPQAQAQVELQSDRSGIGPGKALPGEWGTRPDAPPAAGAMSGMGNDHSRRNR